LAVPALLAPAGTGFVETGFAGTDFVETGWVDGTSCSARFGHSHFFFLSIVYRVCKFMQRLENVRWVLCL
jgi:hypothetical protein